MKILHCVGSLASSFGGLARSVPQLAIAQAARGMEVGLWTPKSCGREIPDLTNISDSGLTLYSGAIETTLEEFGNPDLIHDHGIWLPCHRAIAKICNKRKICRIVSPRGMLAPWALSHKKWKKKIAWSLYQKRDLQTASALHATAEDEARQLESFGLSIPICVEPNGIQLQDFSREGAVNGTSLSNESERQTIGRRKRTALFLGRVHPIKGLSVLLEAWNSSRPVGWEMRIIGPDEEGHRAKLIAQVAELGLSETWSFEDGVEGAEKWRAMAEADLFILPSYSENFGIVVAEALLSGTPVITTTGTPWRKIVEKACGWRVDATAVALAGALLEACSLNDVERRSMGERGNAWIKADLGWARIAENMELFYRDLLA